MDDLILTVNHIHGRTQLGRWVAARQLPTKQNLQIQILYRKDDIKCFT